MIHGTMFWQDRLPAGLVTKTLSNGRIIETFPDMPPSLYAFMERSTGRSPDHEAVSDDLGRTLTYAQLKEKVDRFADYLGYTLSMPKGAHIALMAYSTVEYLTAYLAVIKAGCVAVVLPTKFKQHEIRSLADRADLDCVICDRQYDQWFDLFRQAGVPVISYDPVPGSFALDSFSAEEGREHLPCRTGYEDVCVMMFTSGTTSLSKGVLLTNYNFVHAAGVYQAVFDISGQDKTVICVPVYTITALSAVIGTFLYVGGTIHMQRMFHAAQVLSCILDQKLTYLHAAPTVCSLLLMEKEQFPGLPSLRRIVCGGSRMPAEKIRKLHQWLPDCEYHTVYGMTETTSPGTIQRENAVESSEISSGGFPVPGLSYRVTDENGMELPAGQTGEIQVSGTCVMEGYYKLDTPDYQDGWLKTGDMGYFTPDGHCYIVDRKKDMINRGGEKLTSSDVEEVLYQLDEVEEAAVVGIPDELYGEVPAAMVKPAEGFQRSGEEIQAHLRNRIAKYKIPVKILFASEIPLSPGGKPDKKEIRRMIMAEIGHAEEDSLDLS